MIIIEQRSNFCLQDDFVLLLPRHNFFLSTKENIGFHVIFIIEPKDFMKE